MSEGSPEQLHVLASRGAMVGGAAALIAAFGDFGASWLWLSLWGDRLLLLVRLVATLVPVGAGLGAALAAWGGAACPPVSRLARTERGARRLWPLPFLVLAAVPAAWIAWLLFTGGKTSRLPAREVLVAATALVLLAGAYVALRMGRWLVGRAARTTPARARLLAAALLGGYFAVSKADQTVLPNLYGYLHGTLAFMGWVLAGLAVLVAALHSPRARALDRRGPTWGLVAVMALAALFTLDLLTLDRNPNVHVAMFDARAATTRSVMHAIQPLLRDGAQSAATRQAIERARLERERRQGLIRAGGLPTWPGAHVLLVTIDALRADHLGLYGYERETSPHLDALAERSVVFERAYAQAPHSSYSLSSLMASEYLHETVDLGQPLPEVTLPRALGDDYHTAAFFTLGIFHTEGERLEHYRDEAYGFDRHDHSDVLATRKTDRAIEEIDRIVEMGEPPSLMWVHYFDVHEPYRDTRFGTSDVDRYDGEIRKVDGEVHRLLEHARSRLERDLIVVVAADHGEEFRDHGGVYHGSTLYDEQIRVPLLVHAPGLAARRVVAPVELVDVAPTVLGMLGRPVPSSMRGDDLRALALGRIDSIGPAFAGVTYKRMVVRWPHKLIADLRFNLFELYDLSSDPAERTNLANREPELLEELKGEVYAWIDTLSAPPDQAVPADPRILAIDRGRLRDRRAVEPLGQLVEDEEAPLEMRREAARILGQLADRRAADNLLRAMRSPEPMIGAEAAIALGRMYDDRARDRLRALVRSEDPEIRARAAVSLGRLRDREAVPALIEALWVAPTTYDRQEAVRWLGRLRDERAVEPLLVLIPEFRIRDLSVIALGTIGDRRAYEPLVEMLDWEHHTSIRDDVVRGLGQLGDPRAIPRLVSVAATEPQLENTSESLVRLGAIDAGAIGGADIGPRLRGAAGFGACHEGPRVHDWDYRNRTWCQTDRTEVLVPLRVPDDLRAAPEGATAVVRARRVDTAAAVPVQLRIGDVALGAAEVDGAWAEHRWPVPREVLSDGRLAATLTIEDAAARLRLDHVLLVPRPAHVAAAPGESSTAER